MAPHSSTLAWRIPWMEGPGGLQSMGSLRLAGSYSSLRNGLQAGFLPFVICLNRDFSGALSLLAGDVV